ncbi:hypothetical protein KEH51_27600 [[Brevibacterium] frigoritolerans]|uniref:Uncharacterized protein n=1 Tax=Peribacillus frigoritolerans TaxID=450367 RepID=A0A941J803_9BACI|nr:hypothetical protein [Peribacillus frigoritolerans]
MKKIATLLLNNWLAETTQALAPRRHGRQSAERERNLKSTGMFLEKLKAGLIPTYIFRLVYPLSFSPGILIRLKEICDTPAEKLASRGACAEEAWQTVGGKGADF